MLGVVILGIYIRTLAPTVAGGDSGELITAGYTLGVVHPPGYPLYTLLAKLFTFIPIGTIAWRVNLLSAVCGAAAATLLFLAVARWSRSVWAGLVSASLFAFSRRVWPHAVTAEVFALNNLFIAGIVYLTVRFSGERPAEAAAVRGRHVVACVLFFWIGLGLTNHHTLIFYALPAALFVLLDPAMREPRRIGTYLLCGVLGLIPYLYLPLASARIPLMSWGDQTTAGGFLNHLLRREYGTFRLGIQEQGPDLTGPAGCLHLRSIRRSAVDRPDPGNCGTGAVDPAAVATSRVVLGRRVPSLSHWVQQPRQRTARTRSLALCRRTFLAAAAPADLRLCGTCVWRRWQTVWDPMRAWRCRLWPSRSRSHSR